ncbi:MAG: ribonuclease J, partial [Patescibacteria group bacterium]
TKPKYIIPIGGTFRHMKKYKELAMEMWYQEKQLLLLEDGQGIEFSSRQKASFAPRIPAKNIFVDGLGVGDVGNVVLRDRQVLADDGILIVVVTIERATGELVVEPDLISRGFVYEKQNINLLDNAKKVVKESLAHQGRITDWHFTRRRIQEILEGYLWEQTHRRPMILPVIVEV